MKKVLFLLSFFMFVGFAANAQKKCCASKKASCSKKTEMKAELGDDIRVKSMAIEVAEADDNIKVRTCEKSGKTSFFQKSVCEKSGKVSWNEVNFDEDKKAFTRVASAQVEKEVIEAKGDKKACCSKAEKAACAKGDKKSCSKDKKSCSKDKKAACSKSEKASCSKGAKKSCTKGSKASCSKKGTASVAAPNQPVKATKKVEKL